MIKTNNLDEYQSLNAVLNYARSRYFDKQNDSCELCVFTNICQCSSIGLCNLKCEYDDSTSKGAGIE